MGKFGLEIESNAMVFSDTLLIIVISMVGQLNLKSTENIGWVVVYKQDCIIPTYGTYLTICCEIYCSLSK